MRCSSLSGVVLRLAFLVAPAFQTAIPDLPGQVADIRESLRSRVEQMRSGQELAIGGESIAATRFLSEFYERRDFSPAWTDARNVAVLLRILMRIGEEGLDPADYLLPVLQQYVDATGAMRSLSAQQTADLDILLTESLVRLDYHLRFGKVNPSDLDPNWNFTRRFSGKDPVEVVGSAIASASLDSFLEQEIPQLPFYLRLKAALASYRAIAAAGGWPEVPQGTALKSGEKDSRVAVLRRRLAVTGDLMGVQPSEPELFDNPLKEALIRFQARHGLQADGVAGRNTIGALNVPVQARIGQIEVNLERARWLFHDIHLNDDYIAVDIAAFSAQMIRGRRQVWEAKVQVGKPYRKTPVFKGDMKYLVFSPTWTVPPTILVKDILPRLAKDPGYLKEKRLRVIDRNGRAVNPDSIAWDKVAPRSFPYQLEQAPGPDNALGRVKFMFPNPYLVYLHDTPSQDLFDRPERAFSSGCIRVQNALALAEILLDDPVKWNSRAIREIIESNRPRTVTLAGPIPVLLLYWTAEAGEDGTVRFRNDVYGRDEKILKALGSHFRFHAPVAGPE